jgi:hypothetical protein
VAVFDGLVDVRHEGRERTAVAVRSGGPFVWKAIIEGAWDELEVDGRARSARRGTDEAGRPVSWVTVDLAPGARATVSTPEGVKPTFFEKK